MRRFAYVCLIGTAFSGPAAAQLVGDVYFLPTGPAEPQAAVRAIDPPVLTRAPIDGLREIDFGPEGNSYKVVDRPVWAPSLPGQGEAQTARVAGEGEAATTAAAGPAVASAASAQPVEPVLLHRSGTAAVGSAPPAASQAGAIVAAAEPVDVDQLPASTAALSSTGAAAPRVVGEPWSPPAAEPHFAARSPVDDTAPRRRWWQAAPSDEETARAAAIARLPKAGAPTTVKPQTEAKASPSRLRNWWDRRRARAEERNAAAPVKLARSEPAHQATASGRALETPEQLAATARASASGMVMPAAPGVVVADPQRLQPRPLAKSSIVVGASGPPRLAAPEPAFAAQALHARAPAGTAPVSGAHPGDDAPERFLRFTNPFSRCDGDCGVFVSAGVFLDTPMTQVFGVNGFTAPWDYTFEDSGIIAISVSRPLVSFGRFVDLEPELGVAQRFGEATSTEVWAGMMVRWNLPRLDRWIDTSLGLSIGASYAFKKDRLEDIQDPRSDVEHLLAYFSPEITFKLRRLPGAEFALRLHHRSGGRDYLLGDLFGSNEAGGAQYLTGGVRWRF